MKDISKHKDVAVRALKTAVQAFLAAWALTGNKLDKAALTAAGAAAISAVWNLIVQA